MRSVVCFIIFIFLYGCTHFKAIEDPTPSSIDSNYLTGDTTILGRYDSGYNGITVKRGDSTEGKKFVIHTAGDGELFIQSANCGIDEAVIYKDSQNISLDLQKYFGETFEESCLINLIMFPKFPDYEESEYPMRGMKSKAYIHVIPEDTKPAFLGFSNGEIHAGFSMMQIRERLRNGKIEPRTISIGTDNSSGVIFIEGCGVSLEKEYDHEQVDIKLEELLGTEYAPKDSCIFFGAVLKDDNGEEDLRDLRFAIGINVFSYKYQKLAVNLSVKGTKCTVEGSRYVSYTFIDNKVYNSNKVKFKCKDKDKTYKVRQFTVQGRGIVILIKDRKIIWLK